MEHHAKYLAVKHPDDSEPATKNEVEWLEEIEEAYAKGMSANASKNKASLPVRDLHSRNQSAIT